jgi:hypothetical protein
MRRSNADSASPLELVPQAMAASLPSEADELLYRRAPGDVGFSTSGLPAFTGCRVRRRAFREMGL